MPETSSPVFLIFLKHTIGKNANIVAYIFFLCDTEILVFHFNVIEFTFLYSMRNILNLKKILPV